jgi:hypothetical protein
MLCTGALLGASFTGCAVEDDASWTERGAKYDDAKKECTYTQGYWKTHNVYASQPKKQLAWPLSEDSLACGSTWYELLHTPTEGDAFLILGHQYIAAKLNKAQGAPVTAEVHDAILNAFSILRDCTVDDDEHDDAIALSALLDDFNNGIVGPGSCDDVLAE